MGHDLQGDMPRGEEEGQEEAQIDSQHVVEEEGGDKYKIDVMAM